MSRGRVTGGCLCGAVRFTLARPLRDVLVCHCSLCRRSGTLAGAYTSVPADALALVEEGGLARYVDVNGRERGFCGRCGSTLFWRSGGERVSVSAGALDEDAGLELAAHIFAGSAAAWERLDDGVPQHEGSTTSGGD